MGDEKEATGREGCVEHVFKDTNADEVAPEADRDNRTRRIYDRMHMAGGAPPAALRRQPMAIGEECRYL